VNLYAEVSGVGGGPAALPQGLSPLDGILVPTFGAYDLAVTLLFPFVAIRLVAAEKESGALKLMLQAPASAGSALAAKGVVILAGWLIAWTPGLLALALWKCFILTARSFRGPTIRSSCLTTA
jgi:ABC-2 type transport system permease protein